MPAGLSAVHIETVESDDWEAPLPSLTRLLLRHGNAERVARDDRPLQLVLCARLMLG